MESDTTLISSGLPSVASETSLPLLPLKWTWSSIGNVASFINGDRGANYPKHSDYVTMGVPFVNTGHIDPGGKLAIDRMQYISRKTFDKLRSGKLEKGDIVYCLRGSTIGKIAKVDFDEGAIASSLVVIRSKPAAVQNYLYYFLAGPVAQQLVLEHDNGSAQPNLSVTSVSKVPIPLPPLPEQKAIAHSLGALDDKIELNRRMNATLEGMAQALFKSWFVDFDPVIDNALAAGNPIPDELADRTEVRRQTLANGTTNRESAKPFPAAFQQTKSMGWIPEGWEAGVLGDLCVKIQNGGTPKRANEEYWTEGTIPWLTSGEVRQSVILSVKNTITESGLANSSAKWLPARSTVVAMYGATAGQVAFIHNSLTTNQAVCGLVPKEHFQYFNYLLIEGNVKHFENQARGSAQQNISKGIIEESAAIIPPLNIVQLFEEQAQPLFGKWAKNLEAINRLAKLRDTLLPKLISGDLRCSISAHS